MLTTCLTVLEKRWTTLTNTKSISLQGQLCSRWRAFNCISRSSLDEYKWYIFILSVFSWLLIHVGLESKDPSAEKDHVIQWKAPKQLWSGPCGKTVFHWKLKMAPQKYVCFFFKHWVQGVSCLLYIFFKSLAHWNALVTL